MKKQNKLVQKMDSSDFGYFKFFNMQYDSAIEIREAQKSFFLTEKQPCRIISPPSFWTPQYHEIIIMISGIGSF